MDFCGCSRDATSPRTIINGPRFPFATAILVGSLLAACGAGHGNDASRQQDFGETFRQWRLPDRLNEISGLALAEDERLFAVTDESAIVYELDYEEGRIVKSFAFGDPVARGDFEGIAVLGDTLWLMTSDGTLLAAKEGQDGERVAYRRYETGMGAYCELEGLAQDRAARSLLMACKETRSGKDELKMSEWAVSAGSPTRGRDIVIPEGPVADMLDEKRINPSGVALDPRNGEWVLVAARQHAIVRLSADGKLSRAIIFPKKGRHPQAEGIEVTGKGELLIVDEGGGGRARLAVYAADPSQ